MLVFSGSTVYTLVPTATEELLQHIMDQLDLRQLYRIW